MLTKTEETPAYDQRVVITGKEPYLYWHEGRITIQLHGGRQVHQIALLAPCYLPGFAKGDVLEIRLLRKRTVKTWLGRLRQSWREWWGFYETF